MLDGMLTLLCCWLPQDAVPAEHGMPTGMPPDHGRQKIVAILLAVAMLFVVIELVRKRKLREEYSFLWVGTGVALLTLAIFSNLLTWFQQLVGAAYPTSALFFGGLVFLMLVALQISVRLSKLTFRNKSLTQRVALLEREVHELHEIVAGMDAPAPPAAPAARRREDDDSRTVRRVE